MAEFKDFETELNLGDTITVELFNDAAYVDVVGTSKGKGLDVYKRQMMNYNMGFITDNERYNQVIDTWTHVNSDLSDILYKTIKNDDQGFNSCLLYTSRVPILRVFIFQVL